MTGFKVCFVNGWIYIHIHIHNPIQIIEANNKSLAWNIPATKDPTVAEMPCGLTARCTQGMGTDGNDFLVNVELYFFTLKNTWGKGEQRDKHCIIYLQEYKSSPETRIYTNRKYVYSPKNCVFKWLLCTLQFIFKMRLVLPFQRENDPLGPSLEQSIS